MFNASAQGDEIYPKSALGRASNICTSCMGIAKSLALRICIEKNIPMTAFGWTPGQVPLASGIFKSNPQMIRKMQEITAAPLRRLVGEAPVRPYFLEEEHYAKPERFPYNISPLAFMVYDETKIYEYVQDLGWESRRTLTQTPQTACSTATPLTCTSIRLISTLTSPSLAGWSVKGAWSAKKLSSELILCQASRSWTL